MAYSELIKNFEKVRGYMREFYVYGFKSRSEYDQKSLRSYDNEKRRFESWLGDYMGFTQTAEGKKVFISIDSRRTKHNPLYKAWKTKSFTDGDITLHFILMDIFSDAETLLSVAEIMNQIDKDYLSTFENPLVFDESTIRKKLREYVNEGILCVHKQGRQLLYARPDDEIELSDGAMLDFFSEVAPCGVVGSYLLDATGQSENLFTFKHHYITHTLDSDILCDLLLAISQKRTVEIETASRRKPTLSRNLVVPLQIFISVQNGRQYLLCWHTLESQIKSFRLDYILQVIPGEIDGGFDEQLQTLNCMKKHMWGVMCKKDISKLEHVEFTIHIDDDEEYIWQRLQREKRCGKVERIDQNTCRFSAYVFDTSEMIPWIRTFLCRITDMQMSNKRIEAKFKRDLYKMYKMYGVGGDAHAL